jgi:hypothetical protein
VRYIENNHMSAGEHSSSRAAPTRPERPDNKWNLLRADMILCDSASLLGFPRAAPNLVPLPRQFLGRSQNHIGPKQNPLIIRALWPSG